MGGADWTDALALAEFLGESDGWQVLSQDPRAAPLLWSLLRPPERHLLTPRAYLRPLGENGVLFEPARPSGNAPVGKLLFEADPAASPEVFAATRPTLTRPPGRAGLPPGYRPALGGKLLAAETEEGLAAADRLEQIAATLGPGGEADPYDRLAALAGPAGLVRRVSFGQGRAVELTLEPRFCLAGDPSLLVSMVTGACAGVPPGREVVLRLPRIGRAPLKARISGHSRLPAAPKADTPLGWRPAMIEGNRWSGQLTETDQEAPDKSEPVVTLRLQAPGIVIEAIVLSLPLLADRAAPEERYDPLAVYGDRQAGSN